VEEKLHRRRASDARFAFQVRPAIVVVRGERHVLAPFDVQLLINALTRLPRQRHAAAPLAARRLQVSLAGGNAVVAGDDDELALLRALESIRARQRLPKGLHRLREILMRPVG